jgi:glycolate oxidase FAD binding subunit
MTPPDVLTALRKVCGQDHAREADAADAVQGASAGWVASPATTDEVGEVMRVAAEYSLRVVPRGAGTKSDWGAPPRSVDLVLDTTRIRGIVEHAAGDLVAVVRAGTPLDLLAAILGIHGQRLALDDPSGGGTVGGSGSGTVGGAVATNASGPLRLLYGTPRDLLIGITVVRVDGVVAHAGGKVVKNVAGYDLCKLFTGSYGTLGIITEAVFRLHPLPLAQAFVQRGVASPAEAERLIRSVAHSQIVPAAVELDWPSATGPGTLALLVEGHPAALQTRIRGAGRLLEPGVTVSVEPPVWWGRYPSGPEEITLKITYPIAELATVLHALNTTAASYGLHPASRGSAGSGVLHVGLGRGSDPGAVGEFVGDLRAALAGHDGSVMVLRSPAAVAGAVDVWGPVPAPALTLMQRVKDQFDPEHRCAPGRFVGGI